MVIWFLNPFPIYISMSLNDVQGAAAKKEQNTFRYLHDDVHLSSSWLSYGAANFSYKMSTPKRNTDVTERASTSKEK